MKIKSLILLLILIIPSTLSLFHSGFFGASDDMHIAWLQQMDQSIREGQWPPRYVSDLSFGFGYPLFNFIFPLPYYLAELFHLAGLSFVYSIKAVFIFSLFGSGVSMYLLMRYLYSDWVGMAAAILYIYSPYRSTDIYSRGALGESLAFVFLPLVVYCLFKLKKTNENRWVLWGGLSITGLILTHNIVSYMFIPFAGLLGLIILRKHILKVFLLFVSGLLGSVYFWLPALLDSKLMRYDTVFNYFDHFPALIQLLKPYWGYGASVPGNYDLMSFFVGEVNILVVALAIFVFVFKRKGFKNNNIEVGIWSIFVLGISVVMTNFRSAILWKYIPLIAYFQFPWRYLTLIVLATSMLVGVIGSFKYYKFLSVLVIVLAIGLNYNRFKPHDFLSRDDSYFINRYIPVPVPSSEYLGLEEEYLRLPKISEARPKEVYSRIFPMSEKVKNINLINSLDTEFEYSSDSQSVLNYNKYYFPGWTALIDGEKLDLYAAKPYGQIQFKLPSGNHRVFIGFKETTRNIVLNVISLATILMTFYLGFKKSKDRTLLG